MKKDAACGTEIHLNFQWKDNINSSIHPIENKIFK